MGGGGDKTDDLEFPKNGVESQIYGRKILVEADSKMSIVCLVFAGGGGGRGGGGIIRARDPIFGQWNLQ